MPGRKRPFVKEPNDVLLWYEQKTAQTPQHHAKIKALRLIKEHPEKNLDELAGKVGCSVRTLKRWWKVYCTDGINGLVGHGQPRSRKAKLTEEQIGQLREKFKKNADLSLGQLKLWVEREFGVQ